MRFFEGPNATDDFVAQAVTSPVDDRFGLVSGSFYTTGNDSMM
jgi:hypothetical protein